jgi:hypothetical protein
MRPGWQAAAYLASLDALCERVADTQPASLSALPAADS